MSGSRRVVLLSGLLLVVAAAAGFYYVQTPPLANTASVERAEPRDEAYERFAAAARAAKIVDDPLERCLRYP